MKILIIGGTQFIGRHITQSLISQGDEVTLFHRGRTNPNIFPGSEHLIGDRNTDLSALSTGNWDATIDTSAYLPVQVRKLHEALGDKGGRYVHISSVSAYTTPTAPGYDEELPIQHLADPDNTKLNNSTYGPLKAECERATLETFGSSAETSVSIVRPTYVAGPHDHTGRFTWWVERIARGGNVLAPGPKDNPFQVIDVRDLADFVVRLAHGDTAGTFHSVSPPPPFTFQNFLETTAEVVGPLDTKFVWADPAQLEQIGAKDEDFPLWAGDDEDRLISSADPGRALAAGLSPRPISETIRDIHTWVLTGKDVNQPDVGIGSERELELLKMLY